MNRFLILLFATFALLGTGRAAEAPFEILDGDRVLFLGDTFLEREGTYGYLEARMLEQFPDRTFFVRNLSFAGDTPLGISRASFDPPAKGWERIREQLDLRSPCFPTLPERELLDIVQNPCYSILEANFSL